MPPPPIHTAVFGMEMIRVRSTAIAAVGYEIVSGRLRVEFRHGGHYDHAGVPEHLFRALVESSSKGRFYNRRLRDRYAGRVENA